MSTTIATTLPSLGFDVSQWQGVIDFQKAKAAGIEFAFIKSSAGRDHRDPRFTCNWSASQDAGIPRAAYHWYTPFVSPESQVAWFLLTVPDMGEMPDIIDLEDTRSLPSDYPERIQTFIEMLTKARGGVEPMIYTGYNYWTSYLVNRYGKARCSWASRHPLWIANYRNYMGPIVPWPWAPNRWLFWQYTSHDYGPMYGVQSANVDLDVCTGPLKLKQLPA